MAGLPFIAVILGFFVSVVRRLPFCLSRSTSDYLSPDDFISPSLWPLPRCTNAPLSSRQTAKRHPSSDSGSAFLELVSCRSRFSGWDGQPTQTSIGWRPSRAESSSPSASWV